MIASRKKDSVLSHGSDLRNYYILFQITFWSPDHLFQTYSWFLANEILNACRSVRASHILIGGNGSVCLSGLRKVYHMFHHGRKWNQVHNYPEACSADLQWLSPEILEQVKTSQSHTLNRINEFINSYTCTVDLSFFIEHW